MGRRKDRRRSSISDPSVDPPVTNKDTRMSVKTEKREDKSEAKSDKYEFKVSKIESKTQKSLSANKKLSMMESQMSIFRTMSFGKNGKTWIRKTESTLIKLSTF